MRQKASPEICPVCGEDVPPRALACRECGADHQSGWRDDALIYDGLELPEENTYHGRGRSPRPTLKGVWMLGAVALLVLFLLYSLFG